MKKLIPTFLLMTVISLGLCGCNHVVQTVVLDSPDLKVIHNEHHTHGGYATGSGSTYAIFDIFVNGRKLLANDYSEMIYGIEADKYGYVFAFVPTKVVVIDDKTVLVKTCICSPSNDDPRVTQLSVENGKLVVRPLPTKSDLP